MAKRSKARSVEEDETLIQKLSEHFRNGPMSKGVFLRLLKRNGVRNVGTVYTRLKRGGFIFTKGKTRAVRVALREDRGDFAATPRSPDVAALTEAEEAVIALVGGKIAADVARAFLEALAAAGPEIAPILNKAIARVLARR